MAQGAPVLIVSAEYYEDIAEQLFAGAKAVLEETRLSHDRVTVPGTFEIPAALRFHMRSLEVRGSATNYLGFIALGCVIRGETDHYDHICRETSRALMDIATDCWAPLGFGILTCHTIEQARARADVNGKNKGAEAARACLKMIELKRSLRLLPR